MPSSSLMAGANHPFSKHALPKHTRASRNVTNTPSSQHNDSETKTGGNYLWSDDSDLKFNGHPTTNIHSK